MVRNGKRNARQRDLPGDRTWYQRHRRTTIRAKTAPRYGGTSRKNRLCCQACWPEESRTSEIEILRKAKEYGKKIDLVRNRIPEMICYWPGSGFPLQLNKSDPSIPPSSHRRFLLPARHCLSTAIVNQEVEGEDCVCAVLFLVSTMDYLGHISDKYTA